MKKSIILLAALLAAAAGRAQEPDGKAWEVGAGGSVLQFNRVKFVHFDTTEEGHHVNMQLRHAVYGGNIYAAKGLSDVWAVDFQGTLGYAEKSWLVQVGLGAQWRLGHYFHSRRIDPYLRLGVNYMYKGFDVTYHDSLNGMDWEMENDLNKDGADSRHLFTVAGGVGINMWLSDRFGIGLQADYLLIPKAHVANSLQGTVRLLWRFGKKRAASTVPAGLPVAPVIEYREVVVRDTVYVERPQENIYDLIDTIHFDFDRYDLRPEYAAVIEKVAAILKKDPSRRFLITGYTDARGSAPYDETLSRNRAETVMDALLEQGVPADMLKIAGDGKRVAHAAAAEDDHTRDGDRKVTIEPIANADYWEVL